MKIHIIKLNELDFNLIVNGVTVFAVYVFIL